MKIITKIILYFNSYNWVCAEIKVSDIRYIEDDTSACIIVTIQADERGGLLKGLDLFDPSYSLRIKDKKTGKFIASYAGGGDPANAGRSIIIPANMSVSFAVEVPNNRFFQEKLKGDYEISLRNENIKGVTITVFYDENGKLKSKK